MTACCLCCIYCRNWRCCGSYDASTRCYNAARRRCEEAFTALPMSIIRLSPSGRSPSSDARELVIANTVIPLPFSTLVKSCCSCDRGITERANCASRHNFCAPANQLRCVNPAPGVNRDGKECKMEVKNLQMQLNFTNYHPTMGLCPILTAACA